MTCWLPGVGAEIGMSAMLGMLGLAPAILVTVQGPS